ncbi:MAG: hypothetical protein ACE5EI_10685 [Thermodesulfobacteriota bacterium]
MHIPAAFLLWAAMVGLAVINDAAGGPYVAARIGEYGAHLYKTASIIAVIFIVSIKYFGYLGRTHSGEDLFAVATATGLTWLASSIIFEFIVGHYVFGLSWERVAGDYRLWQGRLWSLVLVSEIAAPLAGAYLARGG